MLTGFDTETFLIGPDAVAPKIVCASFAALNNGTFDALVASNGNDYMGPCIDDMLAGPDITIICHNAAYDLGVIVNNDKGRFPAIFSRLAAGTIKDTAIREKLLNLTTHGGLEFRDYPDGGKARLDYKLATLVKFYLGRDRTDEKTLEDSWRLNYSVLSGKPAEQWPEDARAYALDDAVDAVEVYMAQEARRAKIIEERGFDPLITEDLRTAADFCLFLMTIRGVQIDPVAKAAFEKEVFEQLTPDRMDILIRESILIPGQSAKPHKGLHKNPDGTLKYSKPTKEKISETTLRAYLVKAAEKNPEIKLSWTAKSTRFPDGQISLAGEWFEDNSHWDALFAQYAHRASLQQFVKTEIPRMNTVDPATGEKTMTAGVIHPVFDVLKETGRTSSYAVDTYPSFNGQNVAPRARECYVPRENMVLFSDDYQAMELVTAAQVTYNLFGYSVLRDKINDGQDVHGYLGAQIAYRLNEPFRAACNETGLVGAEEISDAFMTLKKADDDEAKNIFKHYRKFAKPTGLGYPGGLGPDTFIAYAKKTYEVIVDRQTAVELREIWKQTLPEFVEYFRYINQQCIDPFNRGKDKDGKEYDLYHYTTPLGLHRAGCGYCPCANGMALQSPSAEGALIGLFLVTRACYDPTQSSILYGVTFPLIFIHDEIFGETVDDSGKSARVKEVGRLMVEGMRVVTPDVQVRYEGTLMYRWNKFAEPVYDSEGNLQVWTPKQAV